jgi:predicted transposase/invertase (TIGR01784 family)
LEGDNYLSRHLILDAETGEHKLKDLDFNFIELPKFNKTEKELQSLVEKWVYFIKNAENLTVIPPDLDDEGLKLAYTEADRHNWSKKDLEAYSYEGMREADERAEKMLVEQKAKVSNQIEIAKNLINLSSENDFIVKATGLTLEQIQELRTELNK